jgi:hypothetical protein
MQRRVDRCSGEDVVCRHVKAGVRAKGVRPKLDLNNIDRISNQIKIKGIIFSSGLLERTGGLSPRGAIFRAFISRFRAIIMRILPRCYRGSGGAELRRGGEMERFLPYGC